MGAGLRPVVFAAAAVRPPLTFRLTTSPMRLYPDAPARRRSAILKDALTALALVLLAVVALRVYDRVDALSAAGRGAQDAGRSVQRGFQTAGDAVRGLPIVGGQLSGALRDAGDATGGQAVSAGVEGEQAAHDLATLLGWLTFLLPAAALLGAVVPVRVAEIRELAAAGRVLRLDDGDPEHRRLLACRAAFALPYADLLRHTPDPLGDLRAGRHDQLIAALAEDAGLRA